MPTQWKNEEDLSEGIRKLMYRMDALGAPSLKSDIEANGVSVSVQESAFRNTIREVFGADSPEFEEFGNVQMLQGPLRVGMSAGEVALARLRGRDYMVHVLSELIQRLQQKIIELRRRIEACSLPSASEELHPVVATATKDLVASGHAWEALFAAGKALVLHVKQRSGRTDLEGVALMRTVFSKNSPILKFNELATASDLDEQEGMMHLYEGAVMALRNPGGHGLPTGPDERAMQYIQFLSLLAARVDEATR